MSGPMPTTRPEFVNFDPKGRRTRVFQQEHVDCYPNSQGYCSCPLKEEAAQFADLINSDAHRPEYRSGSMHLPVIDLDFPCRLVESGTPGKFHLYLERPVEFGKFVKVLHAMAEAGLVEWGFHDVTLERGYASVRHPARPKILEGP